MPITNKMGLPRPLVEMASREYLVLDTVLLEFAIVQRGR